MNAWQSAVPLAALAILAGCGGATRSGAQPETPAKAPGSPGTATPSGGYAAPPPGYTQEPVPGNGGAPPEDRDLKRAMPTLDAALSTFDQAEARLSAGGSDCHTACRALGSMRRSAERICELEPEGPDHRCERAKKRVQDAERRVQSGCGDC